MYQKVVNWSANLWFREGVKTFDCNKLRPIISRHPMSLPKFLSFITWLSCRIFELIVDISKDSGTTIKIHKANISWTFNSKHSTKPVANLSQSYRNLKTNWKEKLIHVDVSTLARKSCLRVSTQPQFPTRWSSSFMKTAGSFKFGDWEVPQLNVDDNHNFYYWWANNTAANVKNAVWFSAKDGEKEKVQLFGWFFCVVWLI